MLDRLERAVSRARRAGQRLAVFFIDVDDLKHVNDTHPWQHRAGDVLLTSIALGMRGAVRDTDTLGRLAGDEFLVICEEVGDDVAVAELAERLLDATRQPVPLGPQTVHPSVSIGLALSSDEDETAESCSRAPTPRCTPRRPAAAAGSSAPTSCTSTIAPDLVGALHRGELRMQYQPVVSLATGSVLGMSAVLRWVHPTLGMLPAHQVRTALDSAAVLPVVDWCIDRAINDVRTVAPSRVDHVSVWLPVPGRAVQATSTRDALRAAVLGADGSQTPDTAPSLVLDVHEADLATLVRRPSLRRQLGSARPHRPGRDRRRAPLGRRHPRRRPPAARCRVVLGRPQLVLAASENESGETLVRSLVTGATALGVVTIATGVSSTQLLEEARRLGVHAVSGDLIGPAASLEVYSDLLHGEHVTLPGSPAVAIVRPFDDEDYIAPGRPLLSAIRALEEDGRDDLLAEALAEQDAAALDEAEPASVTADPGQHPPRNLPRQISTPAPPTRTRCRRRSTRSPVRPSPPSARGPGEPGAPEQAAARRRRRPRRTGRPRARRRPTEPGRIPPRPQRRPLGPGDAGRADRPRARRRTSDGRPAAAAVARGARHARRSSDPRPNPAAPARSRRPARRAGVARGHPRPARAGRRRGPSGRRRPGGRRRAPESADVDLREPRAQRGTRRVLSVVASDADDPAEPDEAQPPSRQGPHIAPAIDDLARADGPGAAGTGLREGDSDARTAPEVTDITDESSVDLRGRGGDGPRIALRPAGLDTPANPAVAPTLHLRGRGGSDGGSIL